MASRRRARGEHTAQGAGLVPVAEWRPGQTTVTTRRSGSAPLLRTRTWRILLWVTRRAAIRAAQGAARRAAHRAMRRLPQRSPRSGLRRAAPAAPPPLSTCPRLLTPAVAAVPSAPARCVCLPSLVLPCRYRCGRLGAPRSLALQMALQLQPWVVGRLHGACRGQRVEEVQGRE